MLTHSKQPPSKTQIIPFNFEDNEVRTIRDESGEPWFVANDVCKVLEIANPRDAVARLDDDEKGVVSTDTLGGRQSVTIVNEPGLYTLVLSSRKKEAKAFKRWIVHEVLPAIRKTGQYTVKGLREGEKKSYEGIKDLIAIASDYDPNSEAARLYFATLTNKLLYAVSEHTAPELIAERVDHNHPNMGLTTWKGAHINLADALVGKNFLNAQELERLQGLSIVIHAAAQIFQKRGNTMAEWTQYIDDQIITLRFKMLVGKGKYSREKAEEIARREYAVFNRSLKERFVQLQLI